VEKKQTNKKIVMVELGAEEEQKLEQYIKEIEALLESDVVPEGIGKSQCKKCAYYEYCFI